MSELKYCISFDGFTPEIFKQYVKITKRQLQGKEIEFYVSDLRYDFQNRYTKQEVFDNFDAAKAALKKRIDQHFERVYDDFENITEKSL